MKLVDVSSQLIGIPYCLGGQDSDSGGVDCFSLALRYLEIQGIKLPPTWRGLTREDYKEIWLSDPVHAKELMIECMADLMEEIPIHKVFAGDVLLLKMKKSTAPEFLAIYGGNSVCIAASENDGVCALPLNHYEIRKVFRCLQQSP